MSRLQDLPELIVRDVAELQDRTSPGDWPGAMLVTSAELVQIITSRIADMAPLEPTEIERLKLELGKTQAEVIQRQDDLGRLLHAAEAKNEQQARHIDELQAKMTCMCGESVDHSPWAGHSPVSMFDYAVEKEVERRVAGRAPMVAEDHVEGKS